MADVEKWVQLYSASLRSWLTPRMKTREDVEDLMQEVFIACYRHQDEFDPSRCPEKAWIFIVAKNMLISYYRSAKNNDSLDAMMDAAGSAAEPVDEAASQVAQTIENRAIVAELLRQLDERSRQIIVLRFFEGLDHQSIADRLGLTPGNVRVIQKRALEKMQKMMK